MSPPNYFQRLEQALADRKQSKGALAAHLGVALSTVSRWRSATPHADTVQLTADWLGVDAKWLLTGVGGGAASPETAESSADPKDPDVGENAHSVREETPSYPNRNSQIESAFTKIREGLDSLERLMKSQEPKP